ncbi:INPP1 [Cordylochernes scorpioides]|uniref:inositol-1,4-bisphosphate 1-phosphatase n=1 Tax=Cordylochernes scorpioides TaxID=51811 RepID=A0ABY6L960_9ARAC|nr:INPP1 [Cordylochernes scorpioides]
MFPILGPKIYGEESNQFTNLLQQTVTLEVSADQDKTFRCLLEVLNGDITVAKLLTNAVYSTVDVEPTVDCSIADLLLSNIGIWIDPIDGTNEYISGKDVVDNFGIPLSGLRCVSVLIGVFDTRSGVPLIGVVNQPFCQLLPGGNEWQGRWAWGAAKRHYVPEVDRYRGGSRLRVVLSRLEDELAGKLARRYKVIQTAGAGHKLCLVLLQQADLYLLTKGSTFCWDTCAPHAILRARGGGIVRYADAMATPPAALPDALPSLQLTYHKKESRHDQGIIAYLDPCHLEDLLTYLRANPAIKAE